MTSKREVMIEGMVVFGLGILSMVEGIRLEVMERNQMYDVLGPGNYNIGVGLLLIIVSILYCFYFRKERQGKREGSEVRKEAFRKKMVAMFVILGVYITLIHFTGYFIATMAFFLLINRIVGFRSWLLNGGVSIGVSAVFYLLFVYELNMIFPRGILFEWILGEQF